MRMATREDQQRGLQTAQGGAVLARADAPENDEVEIDLLELALRLAERWKLIAAGALLGAAAAAAMVMLVITPTYEATAKLYVLSASNAIVNLSDLQIGNYLTSDYQEVFRNRHVYEEVARRMALQVGYEELTARIAVSNPSDTRILYIKATSDDPVEAMNLANTYAEVAQEFIPQRMEGQQPTLFETAVLPRSPASPNKPRSIALGFAMGALAMCAFVAAQFVLDDRIRTGEDIEKRLGIPVLGIMPLEGGRQERRNVGDRSAQIAKEGVGG